MITPLTLHDKQEAKLSAGKKLMELQQGIEPSKTKNTAVPAEANRRDVGLA